LSILNAALFASNRAMRVGTVASKFVPGMQRTAAVK
jgi:hypothetical protein